MRPALLLLSFILFPAFALAGEVEFRADVVPLKMGQSVTASLMVHTDEKANAVEGMVIFDESRLDFKGVKDSASDINFWIVYPKESAPGKIIFSGITPGGFSGAENIVAGFEFVPKKTGTTSLSLQEFVLLAHDGKGTPLPAMLRSLDLIVEEGVAIEVSKELDIEPPEYFTPVIAQDEDIFNGDAALFFTTSDKQSGSVRYFVKEYRLPILAWLVPWQGAESPYVLKDQSRQSYVDVKAADVAGNERIVTLSPEQMPSRLAYGIIALGLLFACFAFFYSHRRRPNRS